MSPPGKCIIKLNNLRDHRSMYQVLHIIESLEFGGAEKVVVHLANAMADDFKVSLCLTKREGELLSQIKPSILVNSLNAGEGNNLSSIIKLVEIISSNKIDIVHIHNWGVFVESVIAARIAGCSKIFHTVHGPYIQYPVSRKFKIKKFIRHTVEKTLSKLITRHISVSNDIKKYMVKDIGINENKIITIHNGIRALRSESKAHKHEGSCTRFVIVGRVAKIKNHALLLRSLKIVLEQVDASLTIVGDGPELNNIRNLARTLNIEDDVEFLGFRDDVNSLLNEMDILVVSSEYEGISIAILEAMSLGLPVIATCVGGNPETIIHNKTGILVEQNEHSLSEAMIKLAMDPKLRNHLGRRANQLFFEHFSEQKVIDSIVELYKG